MARLRCLLLFVVAPVVLAQDDAARHIATLRGQFPDESFVGEPATAKEKKALMRARHAALRSLARSGRRARPAARVLVRVFDRGDTRSSRLAEAILRGLGEYALPALTEHSYGWDRKRKQRALAILGDLAEAAIPHLVRHAAATSLSISLEVQGQALVRIGKPALPAIIAALEQARRGSRQGLARVLGAMGATAQAALPALRNALKATAWGERERISLAIAEITPDRDEAVAVLIEELKRTQEHPDRDVLGLLAAAGNRARKAVPLLATALARDDGGSDLALMRALWRIEGNPDRVLRRLALELAKPALDRYGFGNRRDENRRRRTLELVTSMGADARGLAPVLIDQVASSSRWARDLKELEKAVDATGIDKNILPRMRRWLRTGSDTAIKTALRVLQRIGPAGTAALPEVVLLLSHKSKAIRNAVNRVMTSIPSGSMLETLGRALATADEDQACTLLERIASHGVSAVLVLPAIRKAYREPGGRACGFVMWTLDRLRKAAKPALPEVLDALAGKDRETRYWAASVVSNLGSDAAVATPVLKTMMKQTPGIDTVQAAIALSTLGESRMAADHLGIALRAPGLQADAIWGLSNVGADAKPYMGQIRKLLKHGKNRTIAAAAYVVAHLGNDDWAAIDGFRRVLAGSHHDARADTLYAIRQLGKEMEPLRPLLERLAKDRRGDPQERAAAKKALAALDR